MVIICFTDIADVTHCAHKDQVLMLFWYIVTMIVSCVETSEMLSTYFLVMAKKVLAEFF